MISLNIYLKTKIKFIFNQINETKKIKTKKIKQRKMKTKKNEKQS